MAKMAEQAKTVVTKPNSLSVSTGNCELSSNLHTNTTCFYTSQVNQ